VPRPHHPHPHPGDLAGQLADRLARPHISSPSQDRQTSEHQPAGRTISPVGDQKDAASNEEIRQFSANKSCGFADADTGSTGQVDPKNRETRKSFGVRGNSGLAVRKAYANGRFAALGNSSIASPLQNDFEIISGKDFFSRQFRSHLLFKRTHSYILSYFSSLKMNPFYISSSVFVPTNLFSLKLTNKVLHVVQFRHKSSVFFKRVHGLHMPRHTFIKCINILEGEGWLSW
jgi:hypothetical protein